MIGGKCRKSVGADYMGCTELSILGGRSSIQGLPCKNPLRACRAKIYPGPAVQKSIQGLPCKN